MVRVRIGMRRSTPLAVRAGIAPHQHEIGDDQFPVWAELDGVRHVDVLSVTHEVPAGGQPTVTVKFSCGGYEVVDGESEEDVEGHGMHVAMGVSVTGHDDLDPAERVALINRIFADAGEDLTVDLVMRGGW